MWWFGTLTLRAWLMALIAMATIAVRAGADPLDYVSYVPLTDGDAATDDRGWANVHINAVSFKSQALTTVGDYQFTSYYGANGKLIVARRNLTTRPTVWDLLRTEFTSYNINDAHNTSSIAIDGDGYLHVSWGMHGGGPLLYTRSTAPVVNDNPLALHGGEVGNAGMLAGQIPLQTATNITYPEFFNVPGSGDLMFAYRTGSSGNGEYQLSRWDNAARSWTSVHTAAGSGDASPVQPWIDNDFGGDSLPNANAYHNGLVFDSTGRMHVTWTWRTGGDSQSGFGDYQSNHNLMYAYSDDLGTTWHRTDGSLFQRNGIHDIDENNATPVVLIPEGSSHINANSSAVGPNDHVYTATYWAPLASEGNHLRQIMLVEYDGDTWHTHQVGERGPEYGNNRIPESQLRNYPLRRPMVMTDAEDRVFVVFGDYQRGGGVSLAYSESAARDDWTFLDLSTDNLGTWSPTFDRARWERDGVLSVYYQPMGLGQTASPVSLLEWDARAYFANMQPPTPPRPPIVAMHETFVAAVPSNWHAQDGSAGMATLSVVDDTAGIDTAGALQIDAATRQGVIGTFDQIELVHVGDKAQLSFDVRLLEYANNSGGFRFGLYHDHDGSAPSSGYRVLVGTGNNAPRTDVQADGGDLVDGDIGFGVNRENPVGFQNAIQGIADHDAHRFVFTLTRTDEGIEIRVLQDGVSSLAAPVLHAWGAGAGAPTPLQTLFNQVMFTTNGGMLALVDNVLVEYLSAAPLVPGDFNDDGQVDGADFVIWQTNFPNNSGAATLGDGDANGDGQVDGADFVIWQTSFPTTRATPVCEPSSAWLMASLGVVVSARRSRRCMFCGW